MEARLINLGKLIRQHVEYRMSDNEFLRPTDRRELIRKIAWCQLAILKICRKEQDLLYSQLHNALANLQYFATFRIVGCVPKSNISEKSIFDLPITISTNQFIYRVQYSCQSTLVLLPIKRCNIQLVDLTLEKIRRALYIVVRFLRQN